MKSMLLGVLLVVSACADAKSSSSSSRSTSYKSSSHKSSSSTRTSVRPKTKTQVVSVRQITSRCSGIQAPFVEYDRSDREWEYECPTGRKMNRFGRCECK
jgi:hypothetical protein